MLVVLCLVNGFHVDQEAMRILAMSKEDGRKGENTLRPLPGWQSPLRTELNAAEREWHRAWDIDELGGEGEIRTHDTGFSPYNGLANRRLRPLGHLSMGVW